MRTDFSFLVLTWKFAIRSFETDLELVLYVLMHIEVEQLAMLLTSSSSVCSVEVSAMSQASSSSSTTPEGATLDTSSCATCSYVTSKLVLYAFSQGRCPTYISDYVVKKKTHNDLLKDMVS